MKTIIILLFISCTLQAQWDGKYEGDVVRSGGKRIVVHESNIPQPSGQPLSTPGEGVTLFYQDFDDMSVNAGVDSDSIDLLFGPNLNYGFGDNEGAIVDAGGGDHFLRLYMTQGESGSNSGVQIQINTEADWGAPDSLDGHSIMGMGWNVKTESGFDEQVGGKAPGGFIVGDWIRGYESGVDPWPVPEMGSIIRKTYNTDELDRTQIYYYGMTTQSGNVFNWPTTYPSTGNSSLSSSWRNHTYILHLPQTPPDSVDGYLEGYVDGVLKFRYDTFSLTMNDTIDIDWALIGWFPGSNNADQNWYVDVDNVHLFYYTEGDSTWTGMKWLAHPDSAFVIDVIEHGETEGGWGQFGIAWWWLLVLIPLFRRKPT